MQALRIEYQEYRERQTEFWLRSQFSGNEIDAMVKSARAAILRETPDLRLPEPALNEFALRRVLENFADQAIPLSFEEFIERQTQMTLPLESAE